MSNFIIKINSSQNIFESEITEPKVTKGFRFIRKDNFDISYKDTKNIKYDFYENDNCFCFITFSKIINSQNVENDNYAKKGSQSI